MSTINQKRHLLRNWALASLVFGTIQCQSLTLAMVPANHLASNTHAIEAIGDSSYYDLHLASPLMQQGKYQDAIPLLREAIEKDPVNLFASFNLGYSYLEMAKRLEERTVYKDKSFQDRLDALLNQSEYYFTRAQNLNPDLSATYFKLGKIALMRSNLAQARDIYEQALETDSENAALQFNLARVYDQMGNETKAIEHYRHAIAIDDTFIFAYNNLGLIYEQNKNFKEAEKAYKSALKQDPSYNYARLNLGNLYAELDMMDEAKATYHEALKHEPQNAWAHLYLGNLYFMTSDFNQAATHYEQSVQSNPDYSMGYYLWAVSLSKMQRFDEALSASLHYIDIDPEGKYSTQVKQLIVTLKLQKSNGIMVIGPENLAKP